MFVCRRRDPRPSAVVQKTTMNMTSFVRARRCWRWGHLNPPKYMWTASNPTTRTPSVMVFGNTARTSAKEIGKKAQQPWRTSVRPGRPGRAEAGEAGTFSGLSTAPMSSWAEGWRQKAGGPGSRSPRTASGGRMCGRTWTSSFRRTARHATGPTSLPALRRASSSLGGCQRPADGPARVAGDDRRGEHLHLQRQVCWRAQGADYP